MLMVYCHGDMHSTVLAILGEYFRYPLISLVPSGSRSMQKNVFYLLPKVANVTKERPALGRPQHCQKETCVV